MGGGQTLTPAKRFLKDPIKFVNENILLVTDERIWHPEPKHIDSRSIAFLHLVDFKEYYKVTKKTVKSSFLGLRKTTKSVAIGVYSVHMADANTPVNDIFPAYICPLKMNAGSRSFLGTDADIMITAELTGCTFGVGSADPKTGARMVMHANAMDTATDGGAFSVAHQQAQQDVQIMNGLKGSIDAMWRPNHYKNGPGMEGNSSTVIGIRSQTPPAWSFYAQSMSGRVCEDSFEMLSVTKIA